MRKVIGILVLVSIFSNGSKGAEPDIVLNYAKVQKFKIQQRQLFTRYTMEDGRPTDRPEQAVSDVPEVHNISSTIEGFLGWISEDEQKKVLDVVIDRYVSDDKNKSSKFTAKIVIDYRKEIPLQLTIHPSQKTVEKYELVINLLDDLLLLEKEKKIALTKTDQDLEKQQQYKLVYTSHPIRKGQYGQWPQDLTKIGMKSPDQMDAVMIFRNMKKPDILMTHYHSHLGHIYSYVYTYDPEIQMPIYVEKNYFSSQCLQEISFEEILTLSKTENVIGSKYYRSVTLETPITIKN